MIAYKPTLAEQSASIALRTFFALVKTCFIALLLTVIVLIAGQSRVAPVGINLLTTLVMENATNLLKPYRGYFPEPYLIHIETN